MRILIALLAGVLLHEGFPRSLMTGILVAFAGAAVIGVATSEQGVAASWGAVLCVAAAFAYAGGVVAQKPLLSRASALQVTWLACTVGALTCLPFAPSLVREVDDAPASAIGSLTRTLKRARAARRRRARATRRRRVRDPRRAR